MLFIIISENISTVLCRTGINHINNSIYFSDGLPGIVQYLIARIIKTGNIKQRHPPFKLSIPDGNRNQPDIFFVVFVCNSWEAYSLIFSGE